MDSAHQVIVAARATNQTSDKQQAAAMMEETINNVGAVPGVVAKGPRNPVWQDSDRSRKREWIDQSHRAIVT